MLNAMLDAIVADPLAQDRWLVLADWLEEEEDPSRAELLRLHRQMLATCYAPERHPERVAWHARINDLLAAGVQPCLPRRTLTLAEGIEIAFHFIPPGAFLLGSGEDDSERARDEPQHLVTLSEGFWLGIHPLTQMQWLAVMRSNPAHFTGGERPVERVSWEDCQTFCEGLHRRTGRSCRLPTEAEWEYACRAGSTTPFHFGDDISTDLVNYDGNYLYPSGQGRGVYRNQTTPVGQFPPNAFGLYDMHGNVWEWCHDWYAPYPGAETPPGREPERILRGGAWFHGPRPCRSAYRYSREPGLRDERIGCRIVLAG